MLTHLIYCAEWIHWNKRKKNINHCLNGKDPFDIENSKFKFKSDGLCECDTFFFSFYDQWIPNNKPNLFWVANSNFIVLKWAIHYRRIFFLNMITGNFFFAAYAVGLEWAAHCSTRYGSCESHDLNHSNCLFDSTENDKLLFFFSLFQKEAHHEHYN